jgi:hypothetical protein
MTRTGLHPVLLLPLIRPVRGPAAGSGAAGWLCWPPRL